jgi:hypothetical protein
MQLRRPAAARSSDRLGVSPPFPPPAERCALMCVLSLGFGSRLVLIPNNLAIIEKDRVVLTITSDRVSEVLSADR